MKESPEKLKMSTCAVQWLLKTRFHLSVSNLRKWRKALEPERLKRNS
jgi:hypothetical protein